jgi:MFS family permease
MAAVAITAPFFLAFRDDPQSERLAGGLIVGTCVVILAYKLTLDEFARRRSKGLPIGRKRKIWIGLYSSLNAIGVVGLADFVFLMGMGFFLVAARRTHQRGIDGWAILFGVIAASLFTRTLLRLLGFATKPLVPSRPPVEPPEEINPDTWS